MTGEVARYEDLAVGVLAGPPRLGRVRLVAVDGPSGAGKTVFADRLAAFVRARGALVEVVHTDDLLDGWLDLVSFWPRLEESVLGPLRRGRAGVYHPYDWATAEFGARAVGVPVPDVLVVEGVTSARQAIRAELTLAVFLGAPRDLRLRRVLARDGEAIALPLALWREREDAFFAEDGTVDAADLVVDGAPEVAHEQEREYVRWTRNPT